MFIVLKAFLSGCIVASASEIAKRSPLTGAILLSVPLTSLLSAIWLHVETKDDLKVAGMLGNVFWAHIPTLLFFLMCPWMLRAGYNFWTSMIVSLAFTAVVFLFYAWCLNKFGIKIYD
jgi:hypothetical protein